MNNQHQDVCCSHWIWTPGYRDICCPSGASTGSVDLLPNAAAVKPHGATKLSKDDGKESDQIYSFDGKTNVVEVPSSTFNHTLGSHFTLSLWMKHEPSGQEAKKKHGKKEQILCNADGESTCLDLLNWFDLLHPLSLGSFMFQFFLARFNCFSNLFRPIFM